MSLCPDATNVWTRCSRPGGGLGGAFLFVKGRGGMRHWKGQGSDSTGRCDPKGN